MSNFTLFTNDQGAQAGSVQYVKDEFVDTSLPANNNSGLTDNASTNPTGRFFANNDSPLFGPKTLYIKDLVRVDDKKNWVRGQPTYRVIWNENFPAVEGFIVVDVSTTTTIDGGSLKINKLVDQLYISNVASFGITGKVRRAAFFINPQASASVMLPSTTGTKQLFIDGTNTGSVALTGPEATSDINYAYNNRMGVFVAEASNETNDLHTIELRDGNGIFGVRVYFENSGGNIELPPGTTYNDKNQSQTTVASSMALAAFGSSLGGVQTIYKTSSQSYSSANTAATMIASIAQGLSGTNTVTVETGLGGSFPAGSGVVIPQGTSFYVGSVISRSTDTLTLSPTLGFGISNLIYKSWQAGISQQVIGVTQFQLAYSIRGDNFKSGSINFISPSSGGSMINFNDPLGRFRLNCAGAYPTLDSNAVWTLRKESATFLLSVEGYFSAAEIEFDNVGATFSYVLSVGGLGSFTVLDINGVSFPTRTMFTDAGDGWNRFTITNHTLTIGGGERYGIRSINLYNRADASGLTTGILARLATNQSPCGRQAVNASLSAPGVFRRVYADQLNFTGATWIPVVPTMASNINPYETVGVSAQVNFQYYGKNFAVIGAVGGSMVIEVDGGAAAAITVNAMIDVATEGWHSLKITNRNSTGSITAIDYQRTRNDIVNAQQFSAIPSQLTGLMQLPQAGRVRTTFSGTADAAASAFQRCTMTPGASAAAYLSERPDLGSALTFVDGVTLGSRFVANENMYAQMEVAAGLTGAGFSGFIIYPMGSRNASGSYVAQFTVQGGFSVNDSPGLPAVIFPLYKGEYLKTFINSTGGNAISLPPGGGTNNKFVVTKVGSL